MLFYLLAPFIPLVLIIGISIHLFNKTTYHQITHNSFFATLNDPGRKGEYLLYKALRSYERDGGKFLFNVYLPKSETETTEIDVLLLHKGGLFVFESKNYGGWIFGDEKRKMWTQSLPQGKGRPSHKEQFLNPIMQNKLHVRALTEYIGDGYTLHPIVVFTDKGTLKKVTVSEENIVISMRDAHSTVRRLVQSADAPLSSEQMDCLYQKLYPCTQVSDEVKQAHIAAIEEKKS